MGAKPPLIQGAKPPLIQEAWHKIKGWYKAAVDRDPLPA